MSKYRYTDLGVKIWGLISQTADDFVVPSSGFIEMFRIFDIDENYSGRSQVRSRVSSKSISQSIFKKNKLKLIIEFV